MSGRRSFGSNYHPCSQSRKISIGVVVDSSANTRPKSASDRLAGGVPNTANVTSSRGNPLEDPHKGEGASHHTLGKQTKAPGQITSPWVSTRSFYQKVSSSEAIVHAKQVSCLPSSSNVLKPSGSGTKEAVATPSVRFFANQVSILQSGSVQQKKLVNLAYQRKAGKEGTMGRVEEFLHAPANEAHLPEKQVAMGTNVTGNNGNDTLRMKLWEILGTVSSPNKQQSNSQTLEAGANNSKPTFKSDEKASSLIKRRQHSDTIETDSDSPDHSVRRPVTRSLTRKKPQTKVSLRKTKMAPSYRYKQVHLEDNMFSFEEGWSQRLHVASSKSKREESERKSFKIDPYKMCFSGQDKADETQRAPDRMKTRTPANSSLLGDKIGILSYSPPKNREPVEPTNGLQEDFNNSPVNERTGQPGEADVPILEEHVDQQEEFSNRSPKNIVNPQYDLQSPAFELKTPFKNSYPCSSSKTDQGEPDDSSPAERAFNMEGICSFKSFLSSKGAYYKANEKMGASNCVRELDSPVVNSVPITKEQAEENRPSRSPCEEGDPESSEDGSPITSYKETGSLSQEIGTAEKPMFVLRPAKRYRKQGVEVSRFRSTPASVEGIPFPKSIWNEDKKGLHGHSEQNGQDGLASAVTLFALALERVKSKMNSMTSRRAAEILMSVSEKIRLQFQNAESQIQADVGKLTSLNKSKRKRLETRFQEQQEQLKLIYERFKEEVLQHLRDCKSTLEGLEADQIEFKGTIEKQKVSHRRLLLQAEEAIETQLDDVQRRITSVHKLAREKMLQLKYAIAECLKDGVLS